MEASSRNRAAVPSLSSSNKLKNVPSASSSRRSIAGFGKRLRVLLACVFLEILADNLGKTTTQADVQNNATRPSSFSLVASSWWFQQDGRSPRRLTCSQGQKKRRFTMSAGNEFSLSSRPVLFWQTGKPSMLHSASTLLVGLVVSGGFWLFFHGLEPSWWPNVADDGHRVRDRIRRQIDAVRKPCRTGNSSNPDPSQP